MKAIVYTKYEPHDVLELKEVENLLKLNPVSKDGWAAEAHSHEPDFLRRK